jgi:DNA-binding SARP family transcriptional activator/tetratricopeptide (TPR) repeat protein
MCEISEHPPQEALVEFRVLGPVELWSDGRRHDIERAKERCVLAILLQTPGRPVSVDRLVGCLWDGDPPPRARADIYTYVSRLRHRLRAISADATIAKFRTGGYVLEVDHQSVDLHRFRTLREQARAIAESGDDDQAFALHRRAHLLLRGEPLAGLPGHWAAATRTAIEEELFAATLERVEVELRLGHHADLVSELRDLLSAHPYNEKLAAHLMEALYRGGRHAEALGVYHEVSHRMRADYGTAPVPALQELQRRILDGDRSLLPVPRSRPAGPTPRTTLPDDIRCFIGREKEIKELLDTASPTRPETLPTVIAIDGMAGVGKTVLSVHLAHRLADDYPDGQLYLDLHGYDADRPPTAPESALEALLGMLGIPAQRVPRSVEDRTALWRSELASRRVLVVLDNAAGREQIRPLLSAAPGCLTIVTSRRRLVGLDDVRSHSLGLFSPSDAARLFELAIGPERAPDPADVAEVVRLVDHLPLAVQLVGNRLRHRTAWTVADLARRLADHNRRLAEIRAEDREITAVFELSFRGLDARARRAFRRLGWHLVPDFTLDAAAATIGASRADADRALDDLLDHHLVVEVTEGRYRFHNLIREYARQLAETEESAAERAASTRRQLDHHTATALLADRLRYPHGRRIASALAPPPPDAAPFTTAEEAGDRLAAEYPTLLLIADIAAERRSASHVALLAHALARFLEEEGHWERAAVLHERAVGAWRELDDLSGEAQALLDLSVVRFRTGQYGEALDRAAESRRIYQAIADRRGVADVLAHRALILWHRSRYDDALDSSREALEIRRSLGDRRGEARVLDHIAIFLEFVGRYQEAADRRNAGLKIQKDIDDPRGLQMSLNNQGDLMLRLGQVSAAHAYYKDAAAAVPDMARQHGAIWRNNMARIALHTGRHGEAIDGFRYALHTYRQIGDRRNEIETLIEIGTTYARMERRGEALIHFEQALALSREISELFEQTKALRRIGEVLLADGRPADAEAAFRDALRLAGETGEPYERARSLDGLGAVHLRNRSRYAARRCWRQSLRFYDRAGMTAEADAVRALLARVTGA